jgi:hypothetical protein
MVSADAQARQTAALFSEIRICEGNARRIRIFAERVVVFRDKAKPMRDHPSVVA